MDKKLLFQCLFSVLVILLIIVTVTSLLITSNQVSKNFLNNTLKVWDNYKRMFLYRYLKNIKIENRILQIHLFKIYKYSITFLRLQDKSLKLIDVFQGEAPYKTNVTQTSGQFYIFMQISSNYNTNSTFI